LSNPGTLAASRDGRRDGVLSQRRKNSVGDEQAFQVGFVCGPEAALSSRDLHHVDHDLSGPRLLHCRELNLSETLNGRRFVLDTDFFWNDTPSGPYGELAA
jgi:hypothetical protein